MCDVICQYKDKCTSYPQWCSTCTNNTGKRNYYKPEPTPYYPYYPYYPWQPYYPPIIWQTTTGNYYSGVGQQPKP